MDDVARCVCCGELRRYYYGSTDSHGRRIRLQVEGWDDEIDGWREAIRLLRGRIRDVEAMKTKPPPPTSF